MKNKYMLTLLLSTALALTACSAGTAQATGSSSKASQETTAASVDNAGTTESDTADDGSGAVLTTFALLPAFDEMFTSRDLEQSCDISTATKITLSNESVTVSQEGIYLITGSLSDGQIIVDVPKTDKVQLVLDNADITCSSSAALYVKSADKVFVTLAESSKNTLRVSGDYVSSDVTGDDNVDGVIFSKDDIVFNGNGSLEILADYGHGIVGKDDVKVTGGTYDITAAGHGIAANDSIRIADGSFRIDSENDCLHSNDYLVVYDGIFKLSCTDDAVHADGALAFYGGDITVAACYEGLEGLSVTVIDANIDITSEDDGINASDGTGSAAGGKSFQLGDNPNENNLPPSGDMSFDFDKGPRGRGQGRPEGRPGSTSDGQTGDTDTVTGATQRETKFGGHPAGGAVNEDCYIRIEGGTTRIWATGRDSDAMDSNGNLIVTGGDIFICGTAPVDYDGTATISGGRFIAYGGANMAQDFSDDSAQPSLMTYLNSTASAGATVNLKDSAGNVILTCTLEHDAQCIIISTPELKSGETYTLTVNDTTYSLPQ